MFSKSLLSSHVSYDNTTPVTTESLKVRSDTFTVSETYHGFRLLTVKEIPAINSTVLTFSHIKTDAKLMYINNSGQEKTFSISFHTPPTNNTGVNHIIEHSVLKGSKKYPVKSPFIELYKRSIGSYIKAMTGPDYTSFPASSICEKDLMNIMSIYLDAVFCPRIYTDSNIFKQEGWRYVLNSKESPLHINGIVLNEMKATLSNPNQRLYHEIINSLLPNTDYRWNAGGNPEEILNLTYESFLDVHKKYYTATNSYIYLYGDLHLDKILGFIDSNYLGKMEKSPPIKTSNKQKSFKEIVTRIVDYPLLSIDNKQCKTFLSLNFAAGSSTDIETFVALECLVTLLMGSETAPLKRAIDDSNIGGTSGYFLDNNTNKNILSITIQNTDEDKAELFKSTVLTTLKSIQEDGFDKYYADATFYRHNLQSRIKKLMPNLGLHMSHLAIRPWILNGDPTTYFYIDEVRNKIMSKLGEGYFEALLDTYLLSNNHSSLVILKPSPELFKKETSALESSLILNKNSLTDKEVQSLVDATNDLNEWQQIKDTEMHLATIPRLSLSDFKPVKFNIDINESNEYGIKLVSHHVYMNGLANISLIFDTSSVPQNKLQYLALLQFLFGNIDTFNMKSATLTNGIMLNSSGVSYNITATGKRDEPGKIRPHFTITFTTAPNNFKSMFNFINNIIFKTNFNNKTVISQIIKQIRQYYQQAYSSGYSQIAYSEACAYLSHLCQYQKEVSGLPFYKFIVDIDDNFNIRWEELLENLKQICSILFCKNNMTIFYGGDIDGLNILKKSLSSFESLPAEIKQVPFRYNFAEPEKNVAYITSVRTQSVIQIGDIIKAGHCYNGKLEVLSKIINLGFLYEKVGAIGGAYSFNASIGFDGSIILASGSDPNLKETLDVYSEIPNFIRNFNPSKAEMEDYIIGTMKDFVNYRHSGPLKEVSTAQSSYLGGVTSKMFYDIQSEILSTTANDIKGYADMIDKVIKQNIYFVEGSRDKINQNRSLFNKIENKYI